jgi:hypothetical protein
MPIRLPHVPTTTVKVTCELDADVHADLEAYAAVHEAERGTPIALSKLLNTIVWDYLRHDPDFMRQRRQAAPAPRARPTPTSTAPQPSGPERRNGPINQSIPRTQGEGGVP